MFMVERPWALAQDTTIVTVYIGMVFFTFQLYGNYSIASNQAL